MKLKIYAVYDSKAAAYNRPFYMHTEGLAIRAIQSAVDDTQHEFHRNAEDFSLFQLGEFEEETGIITPLMPPTVVLNMVQLKPRTFNVKEEV